MRIEVVAYKHEHLRLLNVKQIHQGEVPKVVMNYALTFLLGETPVAILGGFLFCPGVIHIWGLIGEEVRQCPVAFHKACKKVLYFYETRDKPRRIQVDVRVDYMEGQKWVESLGFNREGVMKRFGPNGADHYLYAKVGTWQQ